MVGDVYQANLVILSLFEGYDKRFKQNVQYVMLLDREPVLVKDKYHMVGQYYTTYRTVLIPAAPKDRKIDEIDKDTMLSILSNPRWATEGALAIADYYISEHRRRKNMTPDIYGSIMHTASHFATAQAFKN